MEPRSRATGIPEGWIGRIEHDPRAYYHDGVFILVCRWPENGWYIFSSESIDFDVQLYNDVCMDEQATIEEWFEGIEVTWIKLAPAEWCRKWVGQG